MISTASPLSDRRPRPPRIGYLLRMYPRFSQTFVVNEILELERQGVDLRIASLRRPDDGVFHESISRVRAKADYLPETVSASMRKLWPSRSLGLLRHWRQGVSATAAVLRHSGAQWTDLTAALSLLRWAHKHRLNHVHVHFGTSEATVALLAHLLGGLSYSLTLHAFDIFRDNVDRRLLARKINASSFTVTVTEFNRRYLTGQIPGVDPARVRVGHNGVDLDLFRPGGCARDEFTVFSVGRLIEKKGFIHLVRAIGRLRSDGLPIRCQIAGEGPDEPLLKAEIKRLELADCFELVGPQEQRDVLRRMQRSACFALPCVAARDGNVDALPTVLLEAMACACPTVSTRLSGIPEIIDDGVSGLLVEPGDDRSLASAIGRVMLDRPLATKLAAGSRARVEERFDVRRNVATLRRWLLEASGAGADEDAPAETAPPLPVRVSEVAA